MAGCELGCLPHGALGGCSRECPCDCHRATSVVAGRWASEEAWDYAYEGDPLNTSVGLPPWYRVYELCDCDPAAEHSPLCPGTPVFGGLVREMQLYPRFNGAELWWPRATWACAVHGLLGDINGPVHYQTCPRVLEQYL